MVVSFINFINQRNFSAVLILLTVIYIFPLLSFKCLHFFYPIRPGLSDLAEKKFSPWWAGHQIQSNFNSFPAFENLLKTIPGLFSFWLRMWGSSIEKNIYWTPGSRIYDRNLIHIKKNVILGERSSISSHVIAPKRGKLILYVDIVEIGENSFVGAGSVLTPGVTLQDNSFIKADQRVYSQMLESKNENFHV